MTRRLIWIFVLAAVVLTAGGVWFSTHFERVPAKEYEPPEPEARRNPYLALERFMTRMGRSLTLTGNVREMETLAPGGVLILDRNRRGLMTKARLDTLFNWVGKGGYLIVVPERANMPDPVLDYLHVKWDDEKKEPCSCGLPASSPSGVHKPASTTTPETMTVQIPGAERPLNIAYQYTGFKAGDIDPEWRVARDGDSDWLLHYRYGMGNVSLIVGLDNTISNYSIDEYDHAEFFWKLLLHYQPNGSVTLMTRLPIPGLFDWLMENAWAALISAAALIALWLWQVVPRFGAAQPDSPLGRRELREHLSAVGRFVWRTEGFARWLEVARNSFRERLALRHPAIAEMEHQDQAEALAKLTSRPRQLILSALAGTANNASEFTLMLRTLKNLKHDL